MGYNYGYDYGVSTGLNILGGLLVFVWIILILALAVAIVQTIAFWIIFKKAGKGGWEAIVPFYCNFVLVKVCGLNWWWFLLFFAPLVFSITPVPWIGYLIYIFGVFNCYYNLAKKFNKGIGFAICLTLFTPICACMLAFSKKDVYNNNVVVSNNGCIPPTGNPNSGVNNNYQNNVQSQQNYNQSMNAQMYNNQQTMNNAQQVNPVTQQFVNNIPVMPAQPVQPVVNNGPVMPAQPVTPQTVQNSNCSRCGAPVNPGDRFCMSCGNQL